MATARRRTTTTTEALAQVAAVPRNVILQGDAREVLASLPDECVQCVVSSPPYFGLRDYGVPGQIGLEASLEEWCERLVAVFREVRRVLRPDGTLFLNLGDAYANDLKWGGSSGNLNATSAAGGYHGQRLKRTTGLKPKDLMGQPWMLAFALRADGWYLRSDIIWAKSNPMPESVTDRPTKSHEYLFLLTKSDRYFYDAAAIREPVTGGAHPRVAGRHSRKYVDRDPAHIYTKMPDGWESGKGTHGAFHRQGREKGRRIELGIEVGSELAPSLPSMPWEPGVTPKSAAPGSGIKANASFHAATTQLVNSRNKRSVWTVATEPFPGGHFATFPEALVEPCILAGSRPGDVVLDPFMGSGTVAVVAQRLDRDYLGVELSPTYVRMARQRILIAGCAHTRLADVDVLDEGDAPQQAPLFAGLEGTG